VLLRSLGVVPLSACLAVSARAEPEAVDDDHYRVEKLHLLVHVNADGLSAIETHEVTYMRAEPGDKVTDNAMLAVIQRDLRGQIFYQPALPNPQPRVGSGGRL
jgi:hypothetical protein